LFDEEEMWMRTSLFILGLAAVCVALGCNHQPPTSVAPGSDEPTERPNPSSLFSALRRDMGTLDALNAKPEQLGPGWTKDDLLVQLFASGGGSEGWHGGYWERQVQENHGFQSDAELESYRKRLVTEFRKLGSERGCDIEEGKHLANEIVLHYLCAETKGVIRISTKQATPNKDKTLYTVSIGLREPPEKD
jgi:hypothetical protein